MNIFFPNMLKTYTQCPKKYYFRYAENLSMPVNDEIFETGKNIHALASYYLRGEKIDKLKKSLSDYENKLWTYLKNTKYFKFDCLNTEYNLTVKIKNCYVGGRLDALLKNDKNYYIMDYKTGNAPKNAVYDYQTMVYILAVSEFYKTSDIIFVYIDLKNKKEIEIAYNKDLKNEYINKLSEITDKILKESYKPSKKDCKNCEYRKICYDKLLD